MRAQVVFLPGLLFLVASVRGRSGGGNILPAQAGGLRVQPGKSGGDEVEAETEETCADVFKQHEITDSFGPAVAHSLHSLTLNDLHYYFSPSAPLDNWVPVVDLDLTSTTPVLLHAPPVEDNVNFNSLGLKIADRVLSHMDDNMYDVKNFNGLERIIHALHMHEMWESARPFYQSLETNPADSNLCKCVVDIESNGVMKNMMLTALKIREPEAFYKPNEGGDGYHIHYHIGHNKATQQTGDELQEANGGGEGYHIHYNIGKNKEALQTEDKLPEANGGGEGYHIHYSFGKAALQTGDELQEAMRPLVDEASWQYWREVMEDDMIQYHQWLGLFLHCRLHQSKMEMEDNNKE